MLSMTLVLGAILLLTLSVMSSLSRSSEQPLRTRDPYLRSDRRELASMLGLREVCRSVLNTNSLRFVAANAPGQVVSSYRAQQQRLASLSLRVASAVLVQRLAHDGGFIGFSWSLQASISKLRDALLLVVCNVGRASLGVLRGLSVGIPQRVQILISANILANVGSLINSGRIRESTSAGQMDERMLLDAPTEIPHAASSQDAVKEDVLRALRVSLPNDLSRLIFLATLRDNNSGHYYHPEVAQRFSVEVADRAMLACHHEIYEQVVALSLEDLTDQLDAYMATVRVPKERLIESWTKLRAYRATIPMDAGPISTEIFFMKVGVAVAILEARLPGRIQ
jgi:hypothetical protein